MSERKPVYTADDLPDALELRTGRPGTWPYTRGIYPDMYRGRRWTMRQYAGFGTAEATNRRFRYLMEQGQTGLSTAFDLPTQMGLDSDHARAEGEVGRVGVAIDTIEDMRLLFDGIALEQVSTSMTINATATTLLSLYGLVAEEQGASLESLRGTIQNDVLKEYIARGTYIYPPAFSLRLVVDSLAWCAREMPRWNPISISGYHIREAGATAAQEIAFTFANAICYIEAAKAAGLDIDAFVGRLSFFFGVHNDLFEEVAKFRAARSIWAGIVRDQFGATAVGSARLRFHTQTDGATLTAQQPLNNIVRVTIQALAAVLGGTQSLHTNSFDEALDLPSETSATVALRTQQILACESGVTATADPLGGSYYVERLTADLEAEARDYLKRIASIGGSVSAIESRYFQAEIEREAYEHQQRIEAGAEVVVGVNHLVDPNEKEPTPGGGEHVAPGREQIERLARWREARDGAAVDNALDRLAGAATEDDNLLPFIRAASASGATVGEIADVFRAEYGSYRDPVTRS